VKRVIIESPYAGNVAVNLAYARRCMSDSLDRGEAPFASHLLYTQQGILDDKIDAQRKLGIAAGLVWGKAAELTAVYVDRGVSPGMIFGIKSALELGRTVEVRSVLSEGPTLVVRPRGPCPDLCGACLKPWDPGHTYANGRTLAFPLPAEAVGFFECPTEPAAK
jgi:hypothetical protein